MVTTSMIPSVRALDEAFQTVLAQKGLLAVPVGSTWEVHAR